MTEVIDTMDKLAGVRFGWSIRIADNAHDRDRQTWVRTETGFQQGQHELALRYFTGAVSAGLVVSYDSEPPEPGDYYRDEGYDNVTVDRYGYVVLGPHPEEPTMFLVAAMRSGSFSDFSAWSLDRFQRTRYSKRTPDQRPAWVPQVLQLATYLYQERLAAAKAAAK